MKLGLQIVSFQMAPETARVNFNFRELFLVFLKIATFGG